MRTDGVGGRRAHEFAPVATLAPLCFVFAAGDEVPPAVIDELDYLLGQVAADLVVF